MSEWLEIDIPCFKDRLKLCWIVLRKGKARIYASTWMVNGIPLNLPGDET